MARIPNGAPRSRASAIHANSLCVPLSANGGGKVFLGSLGEDSGSSKWVRSRLAA